MAGASGYCSRSIALALLRRSAVRSVIAKTLSPHAHPNKGLTPAHRTVTFSCLPRLAVGLWTLTSDSTAHMPLELSALPSAISTRSRLSEVSEPPRSRRLLIITPTPTTRRWVSSGQGTRGCLA